VIKGVVTSPTGTAEIGQINLALTTGGTLADRITFYADSVVPVTNDGYAIGSATNQFSDLYLAEGGVINWDNGDATLTQVGNVVTLAGADLKVSSPGTASTSVATIDGTQTLTNKRVTPRVLSATSYTTDTGTSLNADNYDIFSVTAQTGALLFNAPGGTPTDGQKLIITVASSTTAARALTWNSIFEASTVALPTTTAATTAQLNIGFMYSLGRTKWVCIAVA
jgi:hypothetical protein